MVRCLFLVLALAACGSDLGRLCDGKNGDVTKCGSNLSCRSQQQVYATTTDGATYCDTFLVCTKSCNTDNDCLIVGGACRASDTCNGKHNLCTTR